MRAPLTAALLVSYLAASCIAPSPARASSPELIGLERELSALAAVRSGEYGVAALDLRSGSSVAVNGNVAFPMASTVKLAIAATYLTEVDQGRRSLSDTIGGRSAARLMELMIVRSDNVAADRLLASLGGPSALQNWLQSRAITGIRVDRTIAQLLREHGHLADSRDVATPNAMVTLLYKLNSGNILTDASRSRLFDLMSRCSTGTRRIRALLPSGTRVEDKTGTLDGITNDVGVVTMPDGHRVALAIFARGGRDRQSGIAQLARAIYDRFADTTRSALDAFMHLQ